MAAPEPPAPSAPPLPPPPAETTLLLRFGELTLKSTAVRKRFVTLLKRNIEAAFARAKLDCLIRDDWGHLYIDTTDLEAASRICARTFGLVSVSPVAVVPSGDLEVVARAAAAYALRHLPPPARTFAVRPRRTGTHSYTSTELGRVCGASISEAAAAAGHPLGVRLDGPDYEVEVEVRQSLTYLYARRVACAGGMPLGSAGKVVCVIREGEGVSDRDARAAWMLMKRGARPIFAVAGDPAAGAPSPHAGAALDKALSWAPGSPCAVAADPAEPSFLRALADRHQAAAFTIGTLARAGVLDGPDELADGYPTFHPLLTMTDVEVARVPLDA
ncbi:MAG TPA: THUMP domain-containing protein [Candidatus Thermoplasmatota archaeon]